MSSFQKFSLKIFQSFFMQILTKFWEFVYKNGGYMIKMHHYNW